MTATPDHGPQLLMPLLRLVPEPAVEPDARTRIGSAPAPRLVPRLLHLDEPSDGGLAAWVTRVRESCESCLAVDSGGRVVSMSPACGRLLGVDPVRTIGVLLVDLVVLVDFTAVGLPLPDPAAQAPPLRALRSGALARGLLRLRLAEGSLRTYDVVGVPLAGGVGALAFLTEV